MSLEPLQGEEWRPVVGFEGAYSVSNLGRVYSIRKHKIMSPDPTSVYPRIGMSAFGRRRRECVHVLVLEAFVGQSNGLWGLHRNDVKNDNRPDNLYWGTPQQNADDRIRLGGSCRGEKNPKSKMSDELAEWVRESEQSSKALGPILGVASSTIRAIRLGQNRNRDGRSAVQTRNYLGRLDQTYSARTRAHAVATDNFPAAWL